jgi:hypothetical protein
MKITKIILFLFCCKLSLAQMDFSVKGNLVMFLKTLPENQRQKIVFPFQDSARVKWTNLPVGLVPRAGIAYGELSDSSRLAWHRVLVAMLSSQGYLKTTSIMQLDDILNQLYQFQAEQGQITADLYTRIKSLKWSHSNYFISVFGLPDADPSWTINFGGHHLALTFTYTPKGISMTPFFIGTDPAEVKFGKYSGLRVLSKEEDYGFQLIQSLNQAQLKKARWSQAVPSDILTNPNSQQRIDSMRGIKASELNPNQQTLLQLIILEYVHNFASAKSKDLLTKILRKGWSAIYFGWIGSLQHNEPHYYIINSPDFLIEYDNVGFQQDGNHIHAILREKNRDFGEDLLKTHYQSGSHSK